MILLRFGFHLSTDVLRFKTPLFFAVLHSGELVLSHWPKGLGFIVVAQHLVEVQSLLTSRTLRNSFVIKKDGLND